MTTLRNPPLEAFVAFIDQELVVAQALVQRGPLGYEIRHVDDRKCSPELLRELQLDELRSIAQFTESGAFRPLKSAPNLQRGWRLIVRDDAGLELALNQIYPGAIADWFAARSADPPVTHYREFTGRQTGMYRITTMLTDPQVRQVVLAACHESLCLKRRHWTVEGLAPDGAKIKSLIPCLEPCALLLEFARTAMRVEQEEKVRLHLAPSEIAVLQAAVHRMLEQPDLAVREGDFGSALNRRRLRGVLEKLMAASHPETGQRLEQSTERRNSLS